MARWIHRWIVVQTVKILFNSILVHCGSPLIVLSQARNVEQVWLAIGGILIWNPHVPNVLLSFLVVLPPHCNRHTSVLVRYAWVGVLTSTHTVGCCFQLKLFSLQLAYIVGSEVYEDLLRPAPENYLYTDLNCTLPSLLHVHVVAWPFESIVGALRLWTWFYSLYRPQILALLI